MVETYPQPTIECEEIESLEIGCQLYSSSHLTDGKDGFRWLWQGYIAPSSITLLTGQWKIGKTSLLACLLARMGKGGMLAGLEVKPARVLVLTEEGGSLWRGRCLRHGIGDHVDFALHPFLRRPTMRHWNMLMNDLKRLRTKRKVDLVVFDPLATLWPCRDENNVASVLEVLEPLRDLTTNYGLAMLLLHHPRKTRSNGGSDSRGSGAMTAFVDFLIEMHWFAPAGEPDRRRVLKAWSRREATPRQLLIEMTEDSADYVAACPADPEEKRVGIVVKILEAQPNLCCSEILARWPLDKPRPRANALYALLNRATEAKRLLCAGEGKTNNPYRYRCAESEANPV